MEGGRENEREEEKDRKKNQKQLHVVSEILGTLAVNELALSWSKNILVTLTTNIMLIHSVAEPQVTYEDKAMNQHNCVDCLQK